MSFRYEQNYRAVAFRMPDIQSLNELTSLFLSHSIERAELDISPTKGFEVEHYYYYSPQIFSSKLEAISENQKKIRGVINYRYNLYFFATKVKHVKVYFIAVPFLAMALELYPFIEKKISGRDAKYQCVNLSAFLNAVAENRHMQGSLTIKKIKYKIGGDGLADNFIVNGIDIPHSITIKTIDTSLMARGLLHSPEQIRASLTQKSLKLVLEVDRATHYKFWVGKGANNLVGVASIMNYFIEEQLIIESTMFPPLRPLREEEKERE